jgi:hypothetical protein
MSTVGIGATINKAQECISWRSNGPVSWVFTFVQQLDTTRETSNYVAMWLQADVFIVGSGLMFHAKIKIDPLRDTASNTAIRFLKLLFRWNFIA